jgi:cytochrome o ubiquinol oxidase subunit 2
MIYTMNGMTTQLNLMADRAGAYRGMSSHFNGDGFSNMHFTLLAVEPAQFATWVAHARQAGPVLDAANYRALTRQSINVAPYTFRAADAGLFGDIVMQTLPPGPGPEQSRLLNASPRIGGDDAAH